MGGIGSGRRGDSKETTSNYLELDVRYWQRKELLLRFAPTFFCGNWKVDVFRPREAPDQEWVTLSRIHRPSELCHVRLKWTSWNYGGSRAWLLCPTTDCGRRVAILYADDNDGTIACRHCRKLTYETQRETAGYRDLYRAQRIRMKLGGSGSLGDPFPPRPKGMHERTYLLNLVRAQELEGQFLATVNGRTSRDGGDPSKEARMKLGARDVPLSPSQRKSKLKPLQGKPSERFHPNSRIRD